jgi:hypothetical protein
VNRLSEAQLDSYIAAHPHDPNCHRPSREQYRIFAEAEREQKIRAAVEEQRRLGLDRLRRENADLVRANAAVRKRLAIIEDVLMNSSRRTAVSSTTFCVASSNWSNIQSNRQSLISIMTVSGCSWLNTAMQQSTLLCQL